MSPFLWIPEELEALTDDLNTRQKDYDTAKIMFENIKSHEKNLLSKLMNDIDDGKMSEIKLERKARCLRAWIDHEDGMNKARADMIQKQADLTYKQNLYNTLERGIVTRREEMKRGIL